ncbi:hypothetical protein OAE39_02320 [Akkermansiaceae bacterium]|nr:hypothetical protein [Akkermansiaceae bacterium]
MKSGVAIFVSLDYPTGVMKLFSVITAVIALGLCSCERHEWESETPKSSDTINLFPAHGEQGGQDDDAEHKKDDDDAKPKGGEEKKDADSGE